MKLILAYILLFTTCFTFSQNSELNKTLENNFREYSNAITNEDLNSELDLMYPTLFQNYPKEKIINDFQKDRLIKDTTQLTKIDNYLVAIKEISKPIKRNNKEYRIIDFIIIKKITFSKEFFLSQKREDSISNLGKKNSIISYNHSRRNYTIQTILFDKKMRIGVYSYHKKILAVRDLDFQEWRFISDTWWNLNSKSKKTRSSGWTIQTNYKKRNISNIDFDIPKSMLKIMREKTGYNNL